MNSKRTGQSSPETARIKLRYVIPPFMVCVVAFLFSVKDSFKTPEIRPAIEVHEPETPSGEQNEIKEGIPKAKIGIVRPNTTLRRIVANQRGGGNSATGTELPVNDSKIQIAEAPVVAEVPVIAPVPVAPASRKSSGATIFGKVRFQGAPPRETDIPLDPTCGRLHPQGLKTKFYRTSNDGGLADVFVYVASGLNQSRFPAPLTPVLLDQKDCEYSPYVLGMQTGQTLLVRNSDPFMHNVHLTAAAQDIKEINKAQGAKSQDLKFVFKKPELFLRFKCDIHNWMFGYVCVVDHPYFAVSGEDGAFTLPDLPEGRYVVEAIHRKAGTLRQEVHIGHGESVELDFVFKAPVPERSAHSAASL